LIIVIARCHSSSKELEKIEDKEMEWICIPEKDETLERKGSKMGKGK
jgi:hypothetical protein